MTNNMRHVQQLHTNENTLNCLYTYFTILNQTECLGLSSHFELELH